MAPGDWAYKPYDAYVAVVSIRLESSSIIIINIYNFIDSKKVIIIGRIMELALKKIKK